MSGIVWLVGAGPGAADLLTLRAVRVLAEADIVFHDALVPQDVLAFAKTAKRVAVGKRSGRHSTVQRFINKQLADAAQQHAVVVRLKGGDPMLFGRAHEEISFLRERGIDVRIVPGVTAALAASADLGVSLTQRGVSRSVVFATPRAAQDEAPSNWAAAVAAADTAVLYMAAGTAQMVVESLRKAGVSARRPVAVVENASLEFGVAAGRLADLPRMAERGAGGPMLVMIGDVYAALAEAAARDLLPRLASHSA